MGTKEWDLVKSENKLKALKRVLGKTANGLTLVLCHNNPDPNTMASAWGLQFLLRKLFRIKVVIGYGGAITRAENKAMISRLKIEMQHVTGVDRSEYSAIAIVDHQHSTGQARGFSTLGESLRQ